MSTYKNFTNKVELDSWSNFSQEQQIYEQRDNKKSVLEEIKLWNTLIIRI